MCSIIKCKKIVGFHCHTRDVMEIESKLMHLFVKEFTYLYTFIVLWEV